jgi:flagellar motor switch protein FliN/FliY
MANNIEAQVDQTPSARETLPTDPDVTGDRPHAGETGTPKSPAGGEQQPGSFGVLSAFPHTPEFLLDVRLSVSVEVGRVQMPIREVMELAPGTVVELQRSATEPVEIHANGRCIGRGEIVVVGEQFGVRITELGTA